MPQAPPPTADAAAWEADRVRWLSLLRERVFGGWPEEPGPLACQQLGEAASNGLRLAIYEFDSQPHVRLPLYVLHPATAGPATEMELRVLDDAQWLHLNSALRGLFPGLSQLAEGVPDGTEADAAVAEQLSAELRTHPRVLVYAMPRGVGPTAWDPSQRKQVQYRRRFMLLGQTLAGMQAWDVLRAVQATRQAGTPAGLPLRLSARGNMAAVTLYALPFAEGVSAARLIDLPRFGRDAPDLLNWLRWLDLPQLAALAAERLRQPTDSHSEPTLVIEGVPEGWDYLKALCQNLGWSHVLLVERESS